MKRRAYHFLKDSEGTREMLLGCIEVRIREGKIYPPDDIALMHEYERIPDRHGFWMINTQSLRRTIHNLVVCEQGANGYRCYGELVPGFRLPGFLVYAVEGFPAHNVKKLLEAQSEGSSTRWILAYFRQTEALFQIGDAALVPKVYIPSEYLPGDVHVQTGQRLKVITSVWCPCVWWGWALAAGFALPGTPEKYRACASSAIKRQVTDVFLRDEGCVLYVHRPPINRKHGR